MKKPLCWTCKFGLCVRQTDKATIFLPDESEDKKEWEEDTDEAVVPEVKPTEIKNDGYTVICFWNPTKSKSMEPVQFAEVTECNRYEKDSTKKDLTGGDSVVE